MPNQGASSITTLLEKTPSKSLTNVYEHRPSTGSLEPVDVPFLLVSSAGRTAVLVPHATPSEVSTCISDVLRDRSIEAFYEDDKAKVKCTTPEGVNSSPSHRGMRRPNHGIIVVQRRFGVSDEFPQRHSMLFWMPLKERSLLHLHLPPATSPLVSDSEG
jgi:hypothetical protein